MQQQTKNRLLPPGVTSKVAPISGVLPPPKVLSHLNSAMPLGLSKNPHGIANVDIIYVCITNAHEHTELNTNKR